MASISVVVPVYGCKDCLVELVKQLETVLSSLVTEFEVVLVDDRCPQDSWSVVSALANTHSFIKGVRLSRNFGQQAAITAGIAISSKEYVVVMDCDLQDPPSLIKTMYHTAVDGVDVVLTSRITRTHSRTRRVSARVYFSLLSWLSGRNIDGSLGSFSLMTRRVATEFLRITEKDRHYIFVLTWLGFRQSIIKYEHNERYSGESAYGLRVLFRHALSGLFFQSTRLLRMVAVAGLGLSALSVLAAAYVVVKAASGATASGWASLLSALLFLGGATITSVGLLGLYVEKVFAEVKNRPLYVVSESLN